MTTLYHVQKIDESGIPFALIPSGDIWGLMEYLSFQRVRVHYQPHATFFKVSFPHIDPEAAQQFMDDWRASKNRPQSDPVLEIEPASAP